MSKEQVAERYARALYELGAEANQLAPLTAQIASIASAYSVSEDLRNVLDNPLVAESEREGLLTTLATRLGLGPLAKSALRQLARRRRLSALPAIAERLATLADTRANVVRATVTTATTLPESYFSALGARLEQALGKRVVMERKQDPALLAGVITQIGDHTIDGSLRGRLAELQRRVLSAQ